MTKRSAIAVALFISLLAVAAPIVTTLYLARQQNIDSQMAAVATISTDILRRSEETGEQFAKAAATLQATPSADPCSPANVERMSSLALTSDNLQGIGYVSDNQLACSSLGAYGSHIPIGPPDYTGARGNEIRATVKFPLVPDNRRFTILTAGHNGYAAIIDPLLALDETVPSANTSLGLFTYSIRRVITGRGYSDPRWLDKLGLAHQKDFVDGDYLVSLRRSSKFDFVTFAAIPLSSVDPLLRRQAETLLPIGIIAGLVLAATVLYLARIQLALPAVLKSALRRREFSVVYQPVVNLQTRQWIGAEVLVRWQRPGGEMVRPDVFIPVAEDTGLIHRLTIQILEMVGREAESIFERHPDFHLSVNLAPADLATPDTVQRVIRLLEATRAKNSNLIVEATERGLMKTGVAQKLLLELRAHGVQVAIDDFGTGYSSLSYLQTFPIDILKIDKSFVDTIGIDAATSRVVFHIIAMAKALNLQMIAEGVETEAQAKVLRDHGVELAQGWLFAKPMPFKDLIAQLGEASSVQKAE